MNFLVIDSGSTKADWVFELEDLQFVFSTPGINATTGVGLDQVLEEAIKTHLRNTDVIYFYGAGANTSIAKLQIEFFFSPFISTKTCLHIFSDMMGAARACAGRQEAIVGILGTGSNSCLYNGDEITQSIPSLGYVVSDEGSGNHIGKEILRAYFYGQMNADDQALFELNYSPDRSQILHKLYKEGEVSAYLASYAPFMNKCSQTLKNAILDKVFGEFIEFRMKKYADFRKFDLFFVGSIAAAFEPELRKACEKEGLLIKEIVTKPIQNLVIYHKSRENAS